MPEVLTVLRHNVCFSCLCLLLQAALQLELRAADMVKAPFIQHLAEQELQRRQQDDMEAG